MQPSETIDKEPPAEGSHGSDRRRHRRRSSNLLAKAVVLQPSSMFRGEILDISQSGCFVVTKAFLRVELHAKVEVQFKFKNVDYHTNAVVMNIQPGKGVGLEFSFADAQTAEAFLALSEELSAAALPARS